MKPLIEEGKKKKTPSMELADMQRQSLHDEGDKTGIEEHEEMHEEEKNYDVFSGFKGKVEKKFKAFMREPREKSPPCEKTPQSPQPKKDIMTSALFKIPFYLVRASAAGGRGRGPSSNSVPILFSLFDFEVDPATTTQAGKHEKEDSFTISLRYGPHRWRIQRSFRDFIKLHFILQWRHLKGHLPSMPRLHTTGSKRLENVKAYLSELFQALDGCFDNLIDVLEFLQISLLTLHSPDPVDGCLEGYVRIKEKGARFKRYQHSWMIVRPGSGSIVFCPRPDTGKITQVILLDESFRIGVKNRYAWTMMIKRKMKVTIWHSQGKCLQIKFANNNRDREDCDRIVNQLRHMAASHVYCQPHRFGSFAPIRPVNGSDLEWLIDGKEYYVRAAKAILSAKREIYIHGWWVSPNLHLVRPGHKFPEYRLDELLRRKAEEGVKVYIVVFKEITISLYVNSAYTKAYLQSLHPNIRVLRHPDHYPNGVLLWAHHEKILVVDQREAYIGGLDFCFGRFDTPEHTITEAGLWSGIDYANPRIRDFTNVIDADRPIIDAESVPRMPWHDIQVRLVGDCAVDISRHFINRWNFICSVKSTDVYVPRLVPFQEIPQSRTNSPKPTPKDTVQVVRSVGKWSMGLATDTSLYDAMLALIGSSTTFIYLEHQFFISAPTAATNFPDPGLAVKNRIMAALADRIIQAHKKREAFRLCLIMPLQPAFEAPLERPEATTCRLVMQAQYSTLSRGPMSLLGQLRAHNVPVGDYLFIGSLRKWGRLPSGGIVTEQLYVHSKLMIVDDRYAIVGSANINDRSLLGNRDSEIAIILDSEVKVRDLRLRLFREHLGDDHIDGSFDAAMFEKLQTLSNKNTLAFRELFKCTPDDSVKTWSDYRQWQSYQLASESMTPEQYNMLSSIQGSLVDFPTLFLEGEDLTASILSKEFLLPMDVYI